jgi:adenylyltransferase/sulfurtransferase
MELSPKELERYSRHLQLEGVGVEGQKLLKGASVLIVGAGGIGSPLGLYLAAAGIGSIGIVDGDAVEEANLQRQIVYRSDEFGRNKAMIFRENLIRLNPYIRVTAYPEWVSGDNAADLVAEYAVVADSTDTFSVRTILADESYTQGKPYIFGSLLKYKGKTGMFAPAAEFPGAAGTGAPGPCFRCAFPTPPSVKVISSKAAGAMLGVIPGTIGMIMATEILKLVLGKPTLLVGSVLTYDSSKMEISREIIEKRPGCPVCGGE